MKGLINGTQLIWSVCTAATSRRAVALGPARMRACQHGMQLESMCNFCPRDVR